MALFLLKMSPPTSATSLAATGIHDWRHATDLQWTGGQHHSQAIHLIRCYLLGNVSLFPSLIALPRFDADLQIELVTALLEEYAACLRYARWLRPVLEFASLMRISLSRPLL